MNKRNARPAGARRDPARPARRARRTSFGRPREKISKAVGLGQSTSEAVLLPGQKKLGTQVAVGF